ncbi:kynurenine formamidase-like [Periplaneta americana]|uniref:kynurenine formamidase-like n=1 Tax=Periplaneta americana TaxID=6978 RepID=UPI0037E9C3D1
MIQSRRWTQAVTVAQFKMMWLPCTLASLLAVCQSAPIPRTVDLGYGLDDNTVFWPGTQRFNITEQTKLKDLNGIRWFARNTFITTEHIGTHVDAPYHFSENGWKIADIPLKRLFVPGALIDVSEKVQGNNDFELQRKDIEEWEDEHGQLPDDSILLIRFGWSSRYYDNRTEYFGLEKSNASELSFPGLSVEAGKYILEKGSIYAVGVDTPSLDPGKSSNFEVHQMLFETQMFGIENLNLEKDALPAKGFMLHVLPLKITIGTGAPARVIALLNHE